MATATLTYSGELAVWNAKATRIAKAILVETGAKHRHRPGRHCFDVSDITAEQYNEIVRAMHEAGSPGDFWNFPLD